jgi:hypothetical protein
MARNALYVNHATLRIWRLGGPSTAETTGITLAKSQSFREFSERDYGAT